MVTKKAYVTLVTNDNYAMAAHALVRSIVLSGSKADIIVLHTIAVSISSLEPLAELGAKLRAVSHLPTSDEFNHRHGKQKIHANSPFLKGEKPEFHTPLDNFIKLRLWELVEYERIIFLDADTIVIRNIDKLFSYPEFSAAPNVYETVADFHRLNSGVFVATPSLTTFENMIKELDTPNAYWRRTDQSFLEHFFPDWHGLPVFYNMLQYVWFNLPELWEWKSVHVIHYQYEKPWQEDHPKSEQLGILINLWKAYYAGSDIPDLDKLPSPPHKAT
ncbi:glycosyltransferase [Lentilitoribacter sp. EG35]|uniref:glycosyltransferase n=1 Tax=Lentilitoribacter sp. EG35 TaxID=3234192 RepID=UPI003460E7FD